MLAPAPPGLTGIATETILLERTIVADFSHGSDRHLVLNDRNGLLRVTIVAPDHPGGHYVAIVPDGCWTSRVAAFMQFAEKRSPPAASCLHPTTAQRNRLNLKLQILDCLDATEQPKPTLRQIAATILYPRHDLGRAIEWKGSSRRRQTQRWVNSAQHLMQGGYRALLMGRISHPVRTDNARKINQPPGRQTIE